MTCPPSHTPPGHDPHTPTPNATVTFSDPEQQLRDEVEALFAADPPSARFDTYRTRQSVYLGAGDPASGDFVATEAAEQVMRLCAEESAVLAVLDTTPGTPAAAAVLGKLLAGGVLETAQLSKGCPLWTFAHGAPMDVSWRDRCPTLLGGLFAELVMLNEAAGLEGVGCSGHPDLLTELEYARAHDAHHQS